MRWSLIVKKVIFIYDLTNIRIQYKYVTRENMNMFRWLIK